MARVAGWHGLTLAGMARSLPTCQGGINWVSQPPAEHGKREFPALAGNSPVSGHCQYACQGTHVVSSSDSGLLVEGKITLWWSPVKTGKSTALMAMLKALSPGGPEFCGMALAEARQDLVDFDGENFMGKNICSL